MYLSSILLIIVAIFLNIAAADEGCEFSAIRGELKCELITSSDLRPYLPHEDRDLVRWMTLYVGTSAQLHPSSPVPISYPDLSQFPKLSFLRVYIYSAGPSPNYTPDMFRSTGGAISIITLYSLQPVPLDLGLIGTQESLDRLKILRVSNFNITGVTNGNLAALTSLETLQLFNAEEGGEKVLLDSVFRLGRTLPNMNKLSLEDFHFYPLLTSEALLSPLPALQSLTLRMSPPSGGVAESVFFNERIFPALQVLELLSFEFSNFENVNTFFSTPPLTKLRMHSVSPRPLPLSRIAQAEGGAVSLEELSLDNFNIGNISYTEMRHLPNLESLYLSGSEDTIEVSDGAFASNKQLSRLRLTYMPNLQLIAPTALLGLTKLDYLHLGNLNSLRTLSPDTSSLTRLSSLYLTNNRELAEVPVQLVRPLVSLEMLSVRSSLFDQECACQHSFLSSLLTFSRPEPQFRLRSSCHDDGKFLGCMKNYQSSMCWDFEAKCPHFCIPSGNLSYSCACPRGQGDLEEGATCVDLSRCAISFDGIASHYCHSDGFSCVTHLRNQTVSCSCYPDHALNPDSASCRRLADCTPTAEGLLCGRAGLVCSDRNCRCLEGRDWDPATKTCLQPTTPPPATTTVTTTTTTSPITTEYNTSPSVSDTESYTVPTTSTTATTEPVTTEPVEITTYLTTDVTTVPTELTTVPTDVTIDVTTVPTELTTEPTDVTTVPTDVTTVPTDVTTDVTTVTTDVTTVPIELTTVPTDVTTVTTELTTVTTELTTVPTELTTVPTDVTTVPTDVTTVPTDVTTVPTDVTTATTPESSAASSTAVTEPEPTQIVLVVHSDSTADTSPSPESTGGATLFPLTSDLTYILALTLGSLFVGTVIMVLIGLVLVLLAKILMYNRKSKYNGKHESMRSFESSNVTSTPPTTFKELSV